MPIFTCFCFIDLSLESERPAKRREPQPRRIRNVRERTHHRRERHLDRAEAAELVRQILHDETERPALRAIRESGHGVELERLRLSPTRIALEADELHV